MVLSGNPQVTGRMDHAKLWCIVSYALFEHLITLDISVNPSNKQVRAKISYSTWSYKEIKKESVKSMTGATF